MGEIGGEMQAHRHFMTPASITKADRTPTELGENCLTQVLSLSLFHSMSLSCLPSLAADGPAPP